jgi:hypothetical protein
MHDPVIVARIKAMMGETHWLDVYWTDIEPLVHVLLPFSTDKKMRSDDIERVLGEPVIILRDDHWVWNPDGVWENLTGSYYFLTETHMVMAALSRPAR